MDRIPPLKTIRDKAHTVYTTTQDGLTQACAAVLWNVARVDQALEMLSADDGELTIEEFEQHIGQYVLMFALPEFEAQIKRDQR